jgi:hypothetical protein
MRPFPKRVPHVQVVDPAKIGRERIANCKNWIAVRILHVLTDVDLQLYKVVRGETLQGHSGPPISIVHMVCLIVEHMKSIISWCVTNHYHVVHTAVFFYMIYWFSLRRACLQFQWLHTDIKHMTNKSSITQLAYKVVAIWFVLWNQLCWTPNKNDKLDFFSPFNVIIYLLVYPGCC